MRSWPSLSGWLQASNKSDHRNDESRELHLPSSWSLRLRLLFWVTIALLPIAIVSVLQGMDRARSDLAEVRDRLVSTARASATPAQNVLASADQIARAVANLPDVRNISPDCNQEMASALRGLMFFTNISRLDAKGRIVCSAVPR